MLIIMTQRYLLRVLCFLFSLKIVVVMAGYRAKSLEIVMASVKSAFEFNFKKLRMLEFGNQEFHELRGSNKIMFDEIFKEYNYSMTTSSAKHFFSHLGMHHTSIDYNGKDGALNLDVRSNLTIQLRGKYDVVTNIGFSEHVGERNLEHEMIEAQFAAFKNFHDLGDVGSLFIHEVPYRGHWFQHGICDYNLEYFQSLIKANGYVTSSLFISDHLGRKELTVVAIFRKINANHFMSLENFRALPGITSRFTDYSTVVVRASMDPSKSMIAFHIDFTVQTIESAAVWICGQWNLAAETSCTTKAEADVVSAIRALPPLGLLAEAVEQHTRTSALRAQAASGSDL